jgi:AraC-like DNA-binding protein
LAPVVEFAMAARHTFFQRFGPENWCLNFVSFRHREPSDVSPLERAFGVRPRFDAGLDQLGFDASLLDAAMPRREAALADLLESYLDQSRTAPRGTSMSSRVQEILSSDGDPGMSVIARRLGVASRTLQRKLTQEGTSYSRIANRVRRAAAERLLEQHEPAISEVAVALGFGEIPSFHRAFVRWTGATPGEFRAMHRGELARKKQNLAPSSH